MLFEFHRHENSKKPNSVHATFFLSGTRRAEKAVATNGYHEKDGGDIDMSDAFMSSSMPQQEAGEAPVPTKSIMLVVEEELEGTWIPTIILLQFGLQWLIS
jgi:DNA polymerase delta subunit 3